MISIQSVCCGIFCLIALSYGCTKRQENNQEDRNGQAKKPTTTENRSDSANPTASQNKHPLNGVLLGEGLEGISLVSYTVDYQGPDGRKTDLVTTYLGKPPSAGGSAAPCQLSSQWAVISFNHLGTEEAIDYHSSAALEKINSNWHHALGLNVMTQYDGSGEFTSIKRYNKYLVSSQAQSDGLQVALKFKEQDLMIDGKIFSQKCVKINF